MLCLAEFLDFGPEILTRDLNQAQKNSGGRMQKKKEKIDALFPTSSFSRNFGPAIGGQFCFCFFASDFQCVAELVSNHVSKYQVQTPKIGRDIAILSRSGPLARPSSYLSLVRTASADTSKDRGARIEGQRTEEEQETKGSP